ncbi:hypothetical protein ILUMI_01803, partial [Ignelater luminosus]
SQNPNLQPAVPPSRILRLGDRVQSRNYGSSIHWKCGTVVDVLGRLHYLIELDDGYVIKRHIDQLRRTEVSPETITNRKILPNVTSLPDQTSATQNMLGRYHSQAEVVCKQPPALSSDYSGEAAPQLTSAIPSQTSAEELPANATPVVSTPSSQPRKSTRVRKPVVKDCKGKNTLRLLYYRKRWHVLELHHHGIYCDGMGPGFQTNPSKDNSHPYEVREPQVDA